MIDKSICKEATLRKSGIHVGIDVSKALLDVASLPDGVSWQAPNTPQALKSWCGGCWD